MRKQENSGFTLVCLAVKWKKQKFNLKVCAFYKPPLPYSYFTFILPICLLVFHYLGPQFVMNPFFFLTERKSKRVCTSVGVGVEES